MGNVSSERRDVTSETGVCVEPTRPFWRTTKEERRRMVKVLVSYANDEKQRCFIAQLSMTQIFLSFKKTFDENGGRHVAGRSSLRTDPVQPRDEAGKDNVKIPALVDFV